MLVFASYARKDTWRPASVGIISIIIYTIVAAVLLRPIGLYSLMVADAVKHFTHTMMMIWVQNRQIGSLRGFHIGRTVAKSIIAAIAAGLLAFAVATFMTSLLSMESFISQLLVVLAGGLAGVGGYSTHGHLARYS